MCGDQCCSQDSLKESTRAVQPVPLTVQAEVLGKGSETGAQLVVIVSSEQSGKMFDPAAAYTKLEQ
jgi:hypothetical protein